MSYLVSAPYDVFDPVTLSISTVGNVHCLLGQIGTTLLISVLDSAPKLAIRCVLNLMGVNYTGEWYHPRNVYDTLCYLPCDKMPATGTATIVMVNVMYVPESFGLQSRYGAIYDVTPNQPIEITVHEAPSYAYLSHHYITTNLVSDVYVMYHH